MNIEQAMIILDNIKFLLSVQYPTVKLHIVICNNDYHFKIVILDRYDPKIGWIESKVFSCYRRDFIDGVEQLKIFWDTKQHYLHEKKSNGKRNNKTDNS